MGKNATLYLISIIIVIGIYSLNQTASAFVDATIGPEDIQPIETDCFDGVDNDEDGYVDFDDPDC